MNLRVVAEITIILTLSVTCLILLMRIFKYKRNNEMLSNDIAHLRNVYSKSLDERAILLKKYNDIQEQNNISLQQLKIAKEQLAAIEKEYKINPDDVNRLTTLQMTTKLAEIAVINMYSSAFLQNDMNTYHRYL